MEELQSIQTHLCEELVRHNIKELSQQLGASPVKQPCSLQNEDDYRVAVTDISGDMNHVFRVSVTFSTSPGARHDPTGKLSASAGATASGDTQYKFSVVVKMAPNDVLYLKDDENIPVDPDKILMEHAVLREFHSLQEHSVPKVYLLDTQRKAIVMEDMRGYQKLTEVLTCESQILETHMAAIEHVMHCIGSVHRLTWLASKADQGAKGLLDKFSNPSMRRLMSQLLFDKPFDPMDLTNRFQPRLLAAVELIRKDQLVLEKVAGIKTAFLTQNDCLCHGDLSPDNILASSGGQFRIIDMEFAGIGLRAYDVALFLQVVLFQLLIKQHRSNHVKASQLWEVLEVALKGYYEGLEEGGVAKVAEEDSALFVEQVCSLIACEFMWTVFGSYELEEFGEEVEPQEKLLLLAKSFLLDSNSNHSIAWNIRKHLKTAGFTIQS